MGRSSLRFDQNSIVEMKAELKRIKNKMYQRAASSMLDQATDIMHASGEEVPIDTHSLRNSRFIYQPTIDSVTETIVVRFGYGGSQDRVNPRTGELVTTYMVEVHENPVYRHPIGKYKFLEHPVLKAKDTYEQKLVEALGEELR